MDFTLEPKRKIDRRAYTKKKAARIAKEEAKLAEILAGTSFERLSPKSIMEETQVTV